eukprot:TRINITY_DN888_c0_g2_i2.p1 TRINITY_DN888_c0_g2~~TRINITY_DN888_c0_g2_i2.p1  ORF type:complete len:458 (-),score=107.05 TRINITY_DN888_c0_g2_i2:77-1450(-)
MGAFSYGISTKSHAQKKKSNQEGKEITNLASVKAHDQEITSISVALDDVTIATSSQDKTIKLWERRSEVPYLKEITTLVGHRRGVWHVAFSPVDKVLASASGDQTIRLWSLKDYSCLRTLEGHNGSVLQVTFLEPNGLQLASTGTDGLLKLWNIKANECISTMDNHTDKIWSMSIWDDKQASHIVTCGADSTITLWKDNTENEKEKKRVQEENLILATQELENLVRCKSYKAAVKLALSLDQPRQLFNIFVEMISHLSSPLVENTSVDGVQDESELLDDIILSLSVEDLSKFLFYLRDWNTHSRSSIIVQVLLGCLLKHYTATSLCRVPKMKEVLQGLIPYSERHLLRINNLLQQSYMLDYTLAEMKLHTLSLSQPGPMADMTNKEVENLLKRKSEFVDKSLEDSEGKVDHVDEAMVEKEENVQEHVSKNSTQQTKKRRSTDRRKKYKRNTSQKSVD